jgi:hypothetical protein
VASVFRRATPEIEKSHSQKGSVMESQRSALGSWLGQLAARTHRNVVVVALANKMARIAWALLNLACLCDRVTAYQHVAGTFSLCDVCIQYGETVVATTAVDTFRISWHSVVNFIWHTVPVWTSSRIAGRGTQAGNGALPSAPATPGAE